MPKGEAVVTYETYYKAWSDLFDGDRLANVTAIGDDGSHGSFSLVLLDREEFDLFGINRMEMTILRPKKELPKDGPSQETLPFSEDVFDSDYIGDGW
jgi:hypothetical protein